MSRAGIIENAASDGDNGRDSRGRFKAGNKCGKGNPRLKELAELRSEIEKAATPKRMQKVFNALIDKAEQGSVQAMRLLLEFTLTRPKDQSRIKLALPAVNNAEDVASAQAAILAQVAGGAIALEEAAAVMGLLETTRRAIETAQLEARLSALEHRTGELPDAEL